MDFSRIGPDVAGAATWLKDLLVSPTGLIAGVIVLLLVATRFGWNNIKAGNVSADRQGLAPALDAAVAVRAARVDLDVFSDTAAALEALFDLSADANELEQAARRWFSELAGRLAIRLKDERDHHYRVAIWLDDPTYPDRFVGLGHGMFAPGDTDMDFLEKQYTIGGLAFRSVTMTYYCHDRTDPNFKPRKHVPPSFESVFGLALGTETNRWGVMTVDARQANGFPDDAQRLIRRFGELASLGAIVWKARASQPPPGPTSGGIQA